MSHAPIEILLVEDNPGDVELTLEAFQDSKVNNIIHTVGDGAEALDFLYRRGAYSGAARPDVVLLDINLPRVDGKTVLNKIKSDEALQNIPVVMLTSSDAETDIVKSYALHANCYITKPVDLEKFLHVVRSVEHFWLTIVKLPESSGSKEAAA